ncbi:UNVERIFIED_CONTAM: 11-beta-hydroxysteroid dehydrogenase 1A [Sesamum radiatum]|uniref:11-beta-hydroxysteroid dehydrogenase 1A n=1 Tax=Sesamum radiatum TaxID=300843 RepID=A0AAW2WNP7_SESRA
MDLVNAFLNIFAPIFTVTTFFLFFPAYLCFKSLHYFWRSIFSENVAGKVVVIAGASSGIGEHIAYEYGKRGAFLVIGARRENALREVAERAYLVGSPGAIPVPTDISKVEDCKTLIQEAINQFGRLDHLVVAAGVTPLSMFEDTFEVANFAPAMASKAAVVSFFETLRTEFGSDIQITLVTPGLVESEMTKGKFLDKEGKMVVDQDLRDVVMSAIPVELVGRCAKAIVDGACRGDKYLTVPPWFRTTFFIKMMLPEATDWFNRWFCITEPGIPATEAISKKVVDLPGLKDILWPDSIRSPKIKTN